MQTDKHISATVKYRFRDHPSFAWSADQTVNFFSSSEMTSTGHYGWQNLGSGDIGGYFYLKKDLDEHQLGHYTSPTYEGSFACGFPIGYSYPISQYATPSISTLNSMGTTAIARTEPTRSASDLATFIGELRADGLPRLQPEAMRSVTRDAMQVPKHLRPDWFKPRGNPGGQVIQSSPRKQVNAAGSDYLNVEFGWLPLVSDLRKMARSVIKSHDIIKNYREHGRGQKVRRGYNFPTLSDSSSAARSDFLPIPASSSIPLGQGTVTVRRQQDIWFAGAFRYHVPVADSQMEKFAVWKSNAQKLLGVSLTPETVWNVSPWSWLVDWQSNTGDVLHNISALGRDGLVLQYGYMMTHTLLEGTRSARFGAAGWASATRRVETKLRTPATPFGFGFDMTALTSRQSAILAALGMSRV